MPMISFDTTLAPDRIIRVPDEYDINAPISVHVKIDTLVPSETTFDFEEEDVFDFERADRIRALIDQKVADYAVNGCPELDALAEFRTAPVDFKFDREDIHERG